MSTGSRALTLRECADELGLKTEATLKTAIRAGRLRALIVSGSADPTKAGQKLYRVEPEEWARYKASIRTQGTSPAPAASEDAEAEAPAGRKPGRPKKGAAKPTGRMSGYR